MENEATCYLFHYKLKDLDGRLLEASEKEAPMHCTEGKKEVMPSVELALSQMKPGEKKEIQLEPSETYGHHDPEKVWIAPRQQFENHNELKVGDVFTYQSEEHANPVLRVIEITDQEVTLDGNPPLAGKKLNFEIHLLEVSHGSTNH